MSADTDGFSESIILLAGQGMLFLLCDSPLVTLQESCHWKGSVRLILYCHERSGGSRSDFDETELDGVLRSSLWDQVSMSSKTVGTFSIDGWRETKKVGTVRYSTVPYSIRGVRGQFVCLPLFLGLGQEGVNRNLFHVALRQTQEALI